MILGRPPLAGLMLADRPRWPAIRAVSSNPVAAAAWPGGLHEAWISLEAREACRVWAQLKGSARCPLEARAPVRFGTQCPLPPSCGGRLRSGSGNFHAPRLVGSPPRLSHLPAPVRGRRQGLEETIFDADSWPGNGWAEGLHITVRSAHPARYVGVERIVGLAVVRAMASRYGDAVTTLAMEPLGRVAPDSWCVRAGHFGCSGRRRRHVVSEIALGIGGRRAPLACRHGVVGVGRPGRHSVCMCRGVALHRIAVRGWLPAGPRAVGPG